MLSACAQFLNVFTLSECMLFCVFVNQMPFQVQIKEIDYNYKNFEQSHNLFVSTLPAIIILQ